MTKLRPPVSAELALTRVCGHIGWERAAAVLDKKVITLRKWSDPDAPAEISFKDALKLDAAHIAAGGGCAPFRETYELLLKQAAAEASADAERLAQRTATAAKEAGEATASLVMAARPGASIADRLIARRETEEAIAALASTLPDLGAIVPGGPEVPPPAASAA